MSRSDLMREIALKAGGCLKSFFGGELQIRKKGNLDLVTRADETAERLIVSAITHDFPDDGILAEEGSNRPARNAYQWIIDPLDGTTNFAHSLPHFCVSIGLAFDGEVRHGIVYDPMKNELFEAHHGQGARLNGVAIQVAEQTHLGESLAVTGFSYDRRQRMPVLLDRVERLLMHCQGVRRYGSAALDLAYVAAGRFDLFIEDGLNAWDMAAGQLLVREAGGSITALDGSPYQIDQGQVLATNANLLAEACRVLR